MTRTSTRTTVTRVLLAVPAIALAGAALAATPASADVAPAQAAAIGTAVTTSPATAGVPAEAYAVVDVRTAAVDPTWAAARLEPTAPDALDPATVVLRRVAGRWEVVDLGTALVGCDSATPAVRSDLDLGC